MMTPHFGMDLNSQKKILGKIGGIRVFINMKIIITENQHKTLIEGIIVSNEERKERLEKSIELAKNYKNPRQFALDYPKYWNFLRINNLVDTVFPSRKKDKPDGYWTIDNIGRESMKYDSRSDFKVGNQWAYEKAREMDILDALYHKMTKD